jgi:hypothetical protein
MAGLATRNARSSCAKGCRHWRRDPLSLETPPMPEAITIATVAKNSLEEIRVSLSEFKGHRLVDVRIFASFDKPTDEKRATKKGVCFKVEKLDELVNALQDTAAFLKGGGQ